MVLIQFDFDDKRYTPVFSQQNGYGMPKYRGAPQFGGSFWGRIVGFAKGLFSKAAPHLNTMLSQAQPHLRSFATGAADKLINTAVEKVSEKLKKVQEGEGKRKKKRKGIKGTKKAIGKRKTKVKPKPKVKLETKPKKKKRSKFDILADKL